MTGALPFHDQLTKLFEDQEISMLLMTRGSALSFECDW